MSDRAPGLPRHTKDFGRLYDLEDPSPYFTGLKPSDYRMPAVLAGVLEAIHGPLCAARGGGRTLRILDFACGYGAIGALLRHGLTLPELYDRYGQREWVPGDGRRYWDADAAFFAARRAEPVAFEIGGVDVAGAALDYAAAMGFVDRAFHENLVGHAPGDGLARFLQGTHLVVESGALANLLPDAFRHILDCAGSGRRPWFLYGLRPDVDQAALNELWVGRGYRVESLGAGPVLYRKPLSADERAELLRNTRALGKPDDAVMRDDYMLVDVTLVRPERDTGTPPISRLRKHSRATMGAHRPQPVAE